MSGLLPALGGGANSIVSLAAGGLSGVVAMSALIATGVVAVGPPAAGPQAQALTGCPGSGSVRRPGGSSPRISSEAPPAIRSPAPKRTAGSFTSHRSGMCRCAVTGRSRRMPGPSIIPRWRLMNGGGPGGCRGLLVDTTIDRGEAYDTTPFFVSQSFATAAMSLLSTETCLPRSVRVGVSILAETSLRIFLNPSASLSLAR